MKGKSITLMLLFGFVLDPGEYYESKVSAGDYALPERTT